MTSAMLRVRDLRVEYANGVRALDGIGFDLEPGETLAVIGESGAGKSTLALALAGLSEAPRVAGSIRLHGTELVGAPAERLRELRGERIGSLVQAAPLNPVRRLGDLIAEPLRIRRGLGRRDSAARVRTLLAEVGLPPDARELYPHQVSGGQRRRAALALALALDPDLLVLDEPTAGLDTVTAEALVNAVGRVARERAVGVLVITHALTDAVRIADRTMVLYAGQAMESGPTSEVVSAPMHPYTRDLAATYPTLSTTRDLRPIRGQPPDPSAWPAGCPYHPRCAQAVDRCRSEPVRLTAPVNGGGDGASSRRLACHLGGVLTLLEARDVSYVYRTGRLGGGGWRDPRAAEGAVDLAGVRGLRKASLRLRSGESLGVVGPSGSGKSTLAAILAGQLRPDSGAVSLAGENSAREKSAGEGHRRRERERERSTRHLVQLIQQDPTDAVSPRLRVADLLAEPLLLSGRDEDVDAALAVALSGVGLPDTPTFRAAYAHQLSGGQLQRLCVARALLARPRVLVADEPTSMLDPSEQARLLLTLRERQSELGLGLVLVSHDLALVRKACDRVLVIDEGLVVEEGPTESVCADPSHPITRRLLAAAPTLPPSRRQLVTDPRQDAVVQEGNE